MTIPTFPLRERRVNQSGGLTIEVAADSMRVGKTTVVQLLETELRATGLPVMASYEDWQHNPYLKASYKDPDKAFLKSQMWFARRKYEQLHDAPRDAVFIQDLPPEGDYAYAVANLKLGRISPEDFAEYDRYYRGMDWATIPAPDLVIYLEAGDRVLLDRAKRSAREFETVDEDYFLTLKRVNRGLLRQIKPGWQALEINTDTRNLATNPRHRYGLVKKVNRIIKVYNSGTNVFPAC